MTWKLLLAKVVSSRVETDDTPFKSCHLVMEAIHRKNQTAIAQREAQEQTSIPCLNSSAGNCDQTKGITP